MDVLRRDAGWTRIGATIAPCGANALGWGQCLLCRDATLRQRPGATFGEQHRRGRAITLTPLGFCKRHAIV